MLPDGTHISFDVPPPEKKEAKEEENKQKGKENETHDKVEDYNNGFMYFYIGGTFKWAIRLTREM